MSDSYTKLFSSITESTIVSEPVSTRWLWITMLAMANAAGEVHGSVPGLARRANLSMEETEAGLACFFAPDPYSRTKENEGRRIEQIDGGWLLLNHRKYAAMRNADERREYMRKYMRYYRSKSGVDDGDAVNTDVNTREQKLAKLAPPSPSPSQEKQDQKSRCAHSAKSRAVRLPPDWRPTDDQVEWTGRERPDVDVAVEIEKFRDYWHAKAGKDARKVDWAATWRNWIRNSRGANYANGRNSANRGAQSVVEQVEQAIADRKRREAIAGIAR